MRYPESYALLKTDVSAVNLEKAVAFIQQLVTGKGREYICVAPVSTVVRCHDDPDYRQVVNKAALVTPDGMPVVWAGRFAGYQQVSRTYGPDLMRAVCAAGLGRGSRHYLYGGTEKVSAVLAEQLQKEYPGISITGRKAPPFRELTPAEEDQTIAEINSAAPDIVWVGLGSPKQDFWMGRVRDRINAPVMVGVGAAFDFLSGYKRQAPRWMQRSGLEWLYRLCCEPRRLWKRYVFGNSRFIFLLAMRGARKLLKIH